MIWQCGRWQSWLVGGMLAAIGAAAGAQSYDCGATKICVGPSIDGLNFALLNSPQASVAAASKRWGEYVKVELIVTNMGAEPLHFDPTAVEVTTDGGATLRTVPVSELRTASTQHFGFGGFNPSAIPMPPSTQDAGTTVGRGHPGVIIRDRDGQPISTDPANRLSSDLMRRHMQQHQDELKKMLAGQLQSAELERGETIAGFVLVPASKHSALISVAVPFGATFHLPLR